MPDVEIETGLRLFPANNGPTNTVLARDEEIYVRRIVQGANFVQTGGDLSNVGLDITITSMRAYIDGRQVCDTSDGAFTFTAPSSSTIYVMIDRTGRMFHRDTNNPTADSEMALWKIVTNGSTVTSSTVTGGVDDLRRRNQFTEVGVNSDEKVYLSSDRMVYVSHQVSDGRVRIPAVIQPNGIRGLPTPTQSDEAATKGYADSLTPPDAALAVKGITKLSVAPASASNPIAVGDNDARVTADQAAATASIRTIGSGALQAMAGNTRLDQIAVPTAPVSLNSQKITSLGTPTADADAATKAYVDSVASGLDVKKSVRVATTAAVALASEVENGDSIDGVVLATGDRILIKDQASGAENGIYVVAASGAPTRATDADSAAEVTPGMFVFVEEGTTNADSGWVLTTNGSIVVGTTALTFSQFSGAGQITAGDGLTKTGNTLAVSVDGSTLEIASDQVRMKALGTTDAHIAAANKDGADGTPSMRTLGYTAGKAMPGVTRLDQISAPTVEVSMNSQKITNLATPTAAADAASKAYVDAGADWVPTVAGGRSAKLGGNIHGGVAIGKGSDGTYVVARINSDGTITVLYSTDGGYGWKASAANPTAGIGGAFSNHSISVFVTNANTWSVAYSDSSTALKFSKTTNGGTSWTTNTSTAVASKNGVTTAVKVVGVDEAFYVYTVSTTSVGYTKTTNAGSSFTHGTVKTESTNASSECAIATIDGDAVYVLWAGTSQTTYRISKTTDAGSNWSTAATVFTDGYSNGARPSLLRVSDTTVVVSYTTDSAPKMTRSTDSGANWTVVFSGIDYAISSGGTVTWPIAGQGPTDNDLFVYCASQGTHIQIALMYSVDGGATWNLRQGPTPMDDSAMAHRTVNGVIYAEANLLLVPTRTSGAGPSDQGRIHEIRKFRMA